MAFQPGAFTVNTGGIIYEEMPEEHRRTIHVFRSHLKMLKDDCRAARNRRRAMPFLYSGAAWAFLSAGTCWLNLYTYDHTHPRPSHHLWVAYVVGLGVFATLGAVLLLWAITSHSDEKGDWDLVMDRIDEINYGSDVTP